MTPSRRSGGSVPTQDLNCARASGCGRPVERLLSDCGDVLGEEARRRFFGPAGLDIGADTPGEIALSIVAEIHSVLRGRSAGFLRDRRGRIHDREGETVPVDILQES
jgi:hypothetical protein